MANKANWIPLNVDMFAAIAGIYCRNISIGVLQPKTIVLCRLILFLLHWSRSVNSILEIEMVFCCLQSLPKPMPSRNVAQTTINKQTIYNSSNNEKKTWWRIFLFYVLSSQRSEEVVSQALSYNQMLRNRIYVTLSHYLPGYRFTKACVSVCSLD